MNWTIINNNLYKKITFSSTKDAAWFVNEVCILADSQNHHPKIVLLYTQVELYCTTHSQGNTITALDYALAEGIDEIVAQIFRKS